MNKHTDGPWCVYFPGGWGSICILQKKSGMSIARVTLIDSSFPADDESAASNAHLIAAAPELLAALQDAEQRMHSYLILLKCDDEFIERETLGPARSHLL